MSSSHVSLSSDHSDSQNYARDTPANQELVDESRTATPPEVALQEVIFNLWEHVRGALSFTNMTPLLCQGVTSVCEAIHATKVGIAKKKKRTFVKGANLLISSEAAAGNKVANSTGKEKQGEDPTIIRKSFRRYRAIQLEPS
ncbi:hypothetical protein LIER_22404 [Lithospermum erythrorhizon]|uniref:Uncharacterized protein n=1 Tax=Lithospermum erythrorhizon TaxID=34254 RepID=A0AAV3QXZ3_LITER